MFLFEQDFHQIQDSGPYDVIFIRVPYKYNSWPTLPIAPALHSLIVDKPPIIVIVYYELVRCQGDFQN